ncbi:MAG: dTDP-4-dehydrorhamnose 3,5-epimerase [Bacteroidia bacterium]|nr:dTDP-4-dehydrorhamnose 3,5-epimerase [Bacteroidia bacterium]
MNIKTYSIDGLMLIEPRIFEDDRGYFFESFNSDAFKENGIDLTFVQDNESQSSKGVLRGLHFQNPPFEQGKLVRVGSGSILDVAVDIRKNSKTYGQYESVVLSDNNKLMFWIPPGFAHGFLALEEDTKLLYKCTNVYNKQSESGIKWDDKELNIDWNYESPLVSTKDRELADFNSFVNLF